MRNCLHTLVNLLKYRIVLAPSCRRHPDTQGHQEESITRMAQSFRERPGDHEAREEPWDIEDPEK